MGVMTFQLPADLSPELARELERACIAGGPDNMPWRTRAHIENGHLILRRETDESGNVVAPWDIGALGRFMGTSATLMERPLPYSLQLELARGKVNQLRCQATDWAAGGLPISGQLQEQIRDTSISFARALMETPSETPGALALKALEGAYQTCDHLARIYMEQVYQVRHQRDAKLKATLGCRLTSVPRGAENLVATRSFNSICIPFVWSAIETAEGVFHWEVVDALVAWAESENLEITAGPLIDFSSAQLPAWLWVWERDVQGMARLMATYVATAVRRYGDRIQRWQVTAASNSCSVLSLAEEELMWLTVKLVQIARQINPGLQYVVGIAQPWGEYLAAQDRNHSPFLFADTLVRSDLTLAGLDLELIMGVTPRGSYSRDLLDTSRLLDLYALLGVPLNITLGYPSATGTDLKADPELTTGGGFWQTGYTPQTQADWASSFVSLALCKPYVHAVNWAQYSDAEPHPFPHCGLVDATGKTKPAFDELGRLRAAHLN